MLRCLQHPGSEICDEFEMFFIHVTYYILAITQNRMLSSQWTACLRRTGSSMVKSNTLESSQWSLGRAAQAGHMIWWFWNMRTWLLKLCPSHRNCQLLQHPRISLRHRYECWALLLAPSFNVKLQARMTACELQARHDSVCIACLENTQQISPEVSLQV